MGRCFNVAGACDPQLHYMVNLQERLEKIKALVDSGAYFTINRARQYGKTTTLMALADYLKKDYIVISLDFQKLSNSDFDDEHIFSKAFAEFFLATVKNRWNPVEGFRHDILNELAADIQENIRFPLRRMFGYLSELCGTADRPVVLMIDEVDSAANSQVFLDFLAQLRGYYLTRKNTPAFQSVILASVYDVKNISQKIHQVNERKMNSPWNIAADFHVEMSFSKTGISRMLKEYEADHHTGMNTDELAELIVDYSSGYPFLVSRICKLTDEVVTGSTDFPDKASAWTKEGILKAVNLLLSEKNTLFESLINKLHDFKSLRQIVYAILFSGEKIVYNPDEQWLDMAVMFGFVKNKDGSIAIANRIFEMRLYNYFLSMRDAQSSEIYRLASQNKSQYILNGRLNMDMVLQ